MIQGDVSTKDIAVGAVVLVVLLPLLLAAGVLLSRFKNRRFRKAWQPLLPDVSDAKITADGGGAATSWLSGTYRGVPVHASMTPNVARHSGSRLNGNRFSLIVPEVAGLHDWTMLWSTGLPLLSKDGWTLTCEDRTVEAHLNHADLMVRIQPHGHATVRYQAREQTLTWTALIDPYWVLPPDQFRATFDTLLDIAATNRAVNA